MRKEKLQFKIKMVNFLVLNVLKIVCNVLIINTKTHKNKFALNVLEIIIHLKENAFLTSNIVQMEITVDFIIHALAT